MPVCGEMWRTVKGVAVVKGKGRKGGKGGEWSPNNDNVEMTKWHPAVGRVQYRSSTGAVEYRSRQPRLGSSGRSVEFFTVWYSSTGPRYRSTAPHDEVQQYIPQYEVQRYSSTPRGAAVQSTLRGTAVQLHTMRYTCKISHHEPHVGQQRRRRADGEPSGGGSGGGNSSGGGGGRTGSGRGGG